MEPAEKIQTAEPLYTVKQFPEVEPAFSEGSLRWIIFQHKDKLIEKGALHYLGRKALLDRYPFISAVKEGLV